MKKYFALKLGLFLILIAFGLSVKAQNNCTVKLDSAKELFSSGQIEEIPSLLDSCLLNGFSKDEQIQAHLLLIQVYLFDSNRDKAEEVMTRFLHLFPNYKVQPNDPAELVELYKSFMVQPTWGLGITSSVNMSQVSVLQHFSTENLNSLSSKYDQNGVGFAAGLHLNKYFRGNLWLSADILYSTSNFKRTDQLGGGNEELSYSEKTGWFSVPLYLNYCIGKGRLAPYLFAGGEFGYLFVDKTYILRQNLINNAISDVVQKSTDNRKNRESINSWAIGGVGLRYRALSGYFDFALGYKYCLMPFVKKGNRYSNNDALYNYQYIDDDFKINRISCSIGYTKLFYKTKKRNIDNAQNIK